MARYRGKHRKPTHTGRNLAAVSTSGAFLAAGLTAGSTQEAHAASAWDVIAECESGNRNVRNSTGASTASGYYQITIGTWVGAGGREFASEAIGATKAEQSIVAQRIAENRGSLADWNASKSCWGDRISSAVPSGPSTTAAPRQQQRRAAPAPQRRAEPQPQRQDPPNLGQRAADGSGQYRCADDMLHFEACDPHNVGEVVAFPLFTHAESAQPASVAVSKPKHAKPAPALAGKPVVTSGKPAVAEPAAAPAGGNTVTSAAKALLGVPYVWGGTTSSGVDCSGLVYNALRKAGHNPPRTAAALQDWATPISQSQAKAGDLFFWSDGGGTATHTGIYLGAGAVIEASQPGTVVSINNVYSGMTFGRVPS